MNLIAKAGLPNDAGSIALLARLRWIAVTTQLVVIIGVRSFLDPRLPIVPLLGVVGVASLSNVCLVLYGSKATHPPHWFRSVLLLDVLFLTALLALSGGASNPFSVLYTLHVVLAAMISGPLLVAIVVLLCAVGFGLIFVVNIPLPPELGGHMHGGAAFSAHLQGMWLAFATAAVTIGFFVSRLLTLLRKERDEHHRTVRLLGLATLAAGAAHEIGNPLGTIKIAASEMNASLEESQAPPEWRDDVRLILSELERAQHAVQQLALGAGELMGELPASTKLGDVVKLLDSQSLQTNGRVAVSCENPEVHVRWPTQAVLQAVTQVIRNAILASPKDEQVSCRVRADARRVSFEVQDSGAGIPNEIQDRLGEPFFTTREPGQGMGLGLFIARSLVGHLGGALDIESAPGRGTRVEIQIPLGAGT